VVSGRDVILEEAHGWRVLVDPELTFIRIDHQARLQFGSVEFVIESPFELRLEGRTHVLDPADRGGLGPLLALFPDKAATVTVSREGVLLVTFTSGVSIRVPPAPNYEAWNIVGPGGQLVVCAPGGDEPVVWGR
jgi:hypothetical protein